MRIRRALFVTVVASIALLAAGIGSQASGLATASPQAQVMAEPAMTVPYAGSLTAASGAPVAEGAYDFTFALYEGEQGGGPLWSEVQEGITAEGGAFATSLGRANAIPQEALQHPALWLAVGVRGPGEVTFTALAPRQRLSTVSSTTQASPNNSMACPHSHWGEVWTEDGALTSSGLAMSGSGWTSSAHSSGNAAIQGTSSSLLTVVNNRYGVYGLGDDAGVYGRSVDGPGVQGQSDSDNGVVGQSVTGSGVFGHTEHGSGVYGFSAHGVGTSGDSVNNWGVHGASTHSYGVLGRTDSTIGVLGRASKAEDMWPTGSYGVYGEGARPTGAVGYVPDTVGVGGIGYTGVYGYGTDGPSVRGLSQGVGAAVKAEAESSGHALHATQSGAGDGVYVAQYGTGQAGFFWYQQHRQQQLRPGSDNQWHGTGGLL